MKFVSNRSEIDKCNQVTGLQMIYKFLFQELHIISRASEFLEEKMSALNCGHAHCIQIELLNWL